MLLNGFKDLKKKKKKTYIAHETLKDRNKVVKY
jgi:hypothetical protein